MDEQYLDNLERRLLEFENEIKRNNFSNDKKNLLLEKQKKTKKLISDIRTILNKQQSIKDNKFTEYNDNLSKYFQQLEQEYNHYLLSFYTQDNENNNQYLLENSTELYDSPYEEEKINDIDDVGYGADAILPVAAAVAGIGVGAAALVGRVVGYEAVGRVVGDAAVGRAVGDAAIGRVVENAAGIEVKDEEVEVKDEEVEVKERPELIINRDGAAVNAGEPLLIAPPPVAEAAPVVLRYLPLPRAVINGIIDNGITNAVRNLMIGNNIANFARIAPPAVLTLPAPADINNVVNVTIGNARNALIANEVGNVILSNNGSYDVSVFGTGLSIANPNIISLALSLLADSCLNRHLAGSLVASIIQSVARYIKRTVTATIVQALVYKIGGFILLAVGQYVGLDISAIAWILYAIAPIIAYKTTGTIMLPQTALSNSQLGLQLYNGICNVWPGLIAGLSNVSTGYEVTKAILPQIMPPHIAGYLPAPANITISGGSEGGSVYGGSETEEKLNEKIINDAKTDEEKKNVQLFIQNKNKIYKFIDELVDKLKDPSDEHKTAKTLTQVFRESYNMDITDLTDSVLSRAKDLLYSLGSLGMETISSLIGNGDEDLYDLRDDMTIYTQQEEEKFMSTLSLNDNAYKKIVDINSGDLTIGEKRRMFFYYMIFNYGHEFSILERSAIYDGFDGYKTKGAWFKHWLEKKSGLVPGGYKALTDVDHDLNVVYNSVMWYCLNKAGYAVPLDWIKLPCMKKDTFDKLQTYAKDYLYDIAVSYGRNMEKIKYWGKYCVYLIRNEPFLNVSSNVTYRNKLMAYVSQRNYLMDNLLTKNEEFSRLCDYFITAAQIGNDKATYGGNAGTIDNGGNAGTIDNGGNAGTIALDGVGKYLTVYEKYLYAIAISVLSFLIIYVVYKIYCVCAKSSSYSRKKEKNMCETEYEYYNGDNHDGIDSYYYYDDYTDYNSAYNAAQYGDYNGNYNSEYDEYSNNYLSNNYVDINGDFIKYKDYSYGYAYYADL